MGFPVTFYKNLLPVKTFKVFNQIMSFLTIIPIVDDSKNGETYQTDENEQNIHVFPLE